jgi:hypothetical protein
MASAPCTTTGLILDRASAKSRIVLIDTTGRTPEAVAAELAKFIQSLYENQGPAHPG